MARPNPEKDPELVALMRRLELSRVAMGDKVAGIREKIDVPARLKGAICSNPLVWAGGSLGAGFGLTRLFRRRRTDSKKRKGMIGFLLGMAGTLFTLLRPLIQRVVVDELQRRYVLPRAQGGRETRFPLPKK